MRVSPGLLQGGRADSGPHRVDRQVL